MDRKLLARAIAARLIKKGFINFEPFKTDKTKWNLENEIYDVLVNEDD